MASAGPLQAPDAAALDVAGAPLSLADLAESPVDVQTWVTGQTTAMLLQRAAEQDRLALLERGWQDRPPTWIQGGAMVNPADFPSLDDASGKAERDITTLEWVLEEQRRARAGQSPRRSDQQDAQADDTIEGWLRSLLPRGWIATVKANREWVAAGGTVLLLIVWGMAAFARRPTAGPPAAPAAAKPAPRRRRRRRDRHSEPVVNPVSVSASGSGRTRY